MARLEKELATAHTILDVQSKIAGLRGLNLAREGLLMAANRSHCRSAWRRRAGRWACRGRPSTVVTVSLPGASSPVPRPPGPCARANENASWRRFPRRASSTARRPRSSRRFWTKGSTFARNARCIGFWLRASRCANDEIAHSPRYTKPELVATAPNETWSWDITRLLGPKRWTYFYLYVLLDHLQPICGRVDGRRTGELGAGRTAHRANLPQAAELLTSGTRNV